MTPSTDEFRRVMGLFATGVTVVTTADGESVRAMTANSVASVSLDPLSLLVCVNRETVMHGVLTDAGSFCVNILSDQQQVLARACANRDAPEATLAGVAHYRGETGSPVLAESLGFIECRVAERFDFGTHTIVVGEVVALGSHEGRPLLFFGGRYAGLAG